MSLQDPLASAPVAGVMALCGHAWLSTGTEELNFHGHVFTAGHLPSSQMALSAVRGSLLLVSVLAIGHI